MLKTTILNWPRIYTSRHACSKNTHSELVNQSNEMQKEKKKNMQKTWQVFWGSELRSDTEWANVSQRENFRLCDGNIGRAHTVWCVCAYLYMLSDRETNVMQHLRNIFADFFKQVSVGFLAPFKGIWFASPPTLAITDSSSDDTQWNVCAVFTSWQCGMSQLFPVWSCLLLGAVITFVMCVCVCLLHISD